MKCKSALQYSSSPTLSWKFACYLNKLASYRLQNVSNTWTSERYGDILDGCDIDNLFLFNLRKKALVKLFFLGINVNRLSVIWITIFLNLIIKIKKYK